MTLLDDADAASTRRPTELAPAASTLATSQTSVTSPLSVSVVKTPVAHDAVTR